MDDEARVRRGIELQPEDNLFKIDNSPLEINSALHKGSPTPVTLINTRDCFVYDLIVKET